jgi:hypothetical protein
MKKLIFTGSLFSLFFVSSCGKSEVCTCADTGLAMMKEMKEANMDMTKMKSIQKKYEADLTKCQKMDEGKSEADKKKMEEELKACDSYKEMETLSKEIMGH